MGQINPGADLAGAAQSRGFAPPSPAPPYAARLRRAACSMRAAVLIALVLALAALLDVVDPEIAVEVCVILLVLAVAFFAALRSGVGLRFRDPDLVAAQVVALFLALAWLTYRAEDLGSIVLVLYPMAMLHGVLRLEPGRLGWLAAFAVTTLAIAAFAGGAGQRLFDPAALVVPLGALAAALGLMAWSAGYIGRLRDKLAESAHALHEQGEEAARRASRDELTGAYNRRHLMEALEREIARSERLGKPLCVARIDIDHFRDINEAFGYAAGDAVLRRFTEAAHGVIRDVDSFGRIGGTEFLLLMPDTDPAGASIGAERFRAAIESTRVPSLPAETHITCSIGLVRHEKGKPPAAVLGQAEAGVNFAKAAGRNRVYAIGVPA